MTTAAIIREARDWLLDCGAPPDLVQEASDRGIMAEVSRQYVGGWEQFLSDGGHETPTWVEPLVVFG